VVTELRGYEDAMRQVFERQPQSAMYSANPLMRALFDWYYRNGARKPLALAGG
jgi:hypothetical protein